MIRPVRGEALRAQITTYDLEWEPLPFRPGRPVPSAPLGRLEGGQRFRLAGVYDERGYRSYTTIPAFIDGELTTTNRGRRFYAHFGGAADMVHILPHLLSDKRFRISGAFSGSSAILVRVERISDRFTWTFVDSFWTIRTSLRAMGEWLGMPKGSCAWDAPLAELRTYNEQDCAILHAAMMRVQDAVLSEGGELGITAASTSMRTFLRRFLKRPIRNSEAVDAYARRSYVASRVEVFRPNCERANYYDINSSFPYSMTMACPGNPGRMRRTLPKRGLWIADCDVATLPGEDYPTLPFRSASGRVFFPRGAFRASITSEDLQAGGFRILRVHSAVGFEERDDLREFAETFYRLRQQSGFEGKVYKIVLNSLYGKFAERPEKEVLLGNPRERYLEGQNMIAPGVVVATEVRPVKHSHVAISSLITARSRRLLLEHIRAAARRGRVYYCDTDSVVCDAELPTSKELGGLKHEYEIRDGRFYAPKLYAFRAEGKDHVKAKGFSRVVGEAGEASPITYEQFAKLVSGERVQIERMQRVRELLRESGPGWEPRSILASKGIRVDLRPKRKPTDDGGSEPWDVREIAGE